MYEIAAIAPEAFKIADRLTLLMEEHEPPVTRSELADAIGCARSTISRYCDGTNSVAFIFAIRIARFFNVSLDYLVGLTDSKEIPQWQKPGKHKHSEHWQLKNIMGEFAKLRGKSIGEVENALMRQISAPEGASLETIDDNLASTAKIQMAMWLKAAKEQS